MLEISGTGVALFCHYQLCRFGEKDNVDITGEIDLKSWGVILVTAMGFILGIVLAGIGGVSAKTFLFSDQQKQQSKKIENYWLATGLSSDEMFELISNSNCHSSEKYFLACVNSIVQAAAGFHLKLSASTGLLEPISKSDLTDEFSEKEKLSPFVDIYSKQKNANIDFEKIWTNLLVLEEPQKKSMLIASGINSFLSVYKDPHTYILPENYYEEVGSQIERSNLFIGVSFERANQKTKIRKIFKNSDAEVAGLRANDILISIDKKSAENLNLTDLSQILKNENEKQFSFEIERNGLLKTFLVNRRFQNLSHVQFEVLSGLKNYAVLTLTKFNHGVCEEAAKKIKTAANKNIAGLILDLRDNPGGQLDEAACLAGLFLGMNKKTYSVEFFDPLKASEVVLSTGSLLYTGPLVVLQNSSSASASELLAGALQEYKRAIVVGEKSFGKGTFQESEVWNKNSQVSLFKTQGFYLLPSQKSTQLVGIEPDLKIEEPHLHLREENIYFNPIHNEKNESNQQAKSFGLLNESLDKCLHYTDIVIENDPILQAGFQVLSCSRVTSLLATQFNTDDFN